MNRTLNKLARIGFTCVLAILAVLIPSLAFAQTAGPFDPPSGDQFVKLFVNTMFGPIVGSAEAGSNPIGPIVEVFNSAVLMVAGCMFAYTQLMGTLATAHEGEVLGKRWSSMWVPLRLALGASVLMPVKSGFCIMQMIVLWMAMQGIGIADKIWSAFTANPIDNATYVMPDLSNQVRELAGKMLVLQACRYGYQLEANSDSNKGWFGKLVDGDYVSDVAPQSSSNGQEIDYGPCGSTYQLTGAQIASNAGVSLSNTGQALTNAKAVASGLYPIHAQQLTQMASDAQALAKTLGPNSQQAVNAYMDTEATRYTNALNQALTTANQATMNQNILDDMSKDGFLFAGAYYLQITTAQDQITQAITAFPRITNGSVNAQELHDSSIAEMKFATDFVKNANKAHQTGLGADSDSDSGMMAKMLTWFTQGKGLDFQSDATLNTNPIIRAKNLGNSMITWGWSTLGVGLGAGGIAGLAGGNVFGKLAGTDVAILSGMTLVAPFLFALCFSLISTGFALAGYLPMVPYIIWMGSMVGFCIILIEAIYAAPLWAFTHIIPDGDGVVGRGGQGYMLALSLMMRPALMVMGLVASIVLMKPIGYVITSTFAAAYNIAAMQNSGWGGLTLTIGGCILYFVVLTATIHRIFSLIHAIPDSIMRWLGGPAGHELGDHSTKMEGHAHHQSAASIGAITGLGGSIAGLGAGIQKNMEKRDEARAKALDEADKRARSTLDVKNDSMGKTDKENDKGDRKPGSNKTSGSTQGKQGGDSSTAPDLGKQNSQHDAGNSPEHNQDTTSTPAMADTKQSLEDGHSKTESNVAYDRSQETSEEIQNDATQSTVTSQSNDSKKGAPNPIEKQTLDNATSNQDGLPSIQSSQAPMKADLEQEKKPALVIDTKQPTLTGFENSDDDDK